MDPDREADRLLADLRRRAGSDAAYRRELEAALRERLAINLELVMTNANLTRRVALLERRET